MSSAPPQKKQRFFSSGGSFSFSFQLNSSQARRRSARLLSSRCFFAWVHATPAQRAERASDETEMPERWRKRQGASRSHNIHQQPQNGQRGAGCGGPASFGASRARTWRAELRAAWRCGCALSFARGPWPCHGAGLPSHATWSRAAFALAHYLLIRVIITLSFFLAKALASRRLLL